MRRKSETIAGLVLMVVLLGLGVQRLYAAWDQTHLMVKGVAVLVIAVLCVMLVDLCRRLR